MLWPSSGVGGSGRARRGCRMSPDGFGEHDVVARLVAVLHADAREQVGHLVILRLRPLLQRMIVAAGAGDALAQERLGGVLGDVDRVLVQDEVVQRAVLPRAAGRREDLAGELVPRLVLLSRSRGSSRRTPTSPWSSASGWRPAAGPTTCTPSNPRTRRARERVDELRALVRRLCRRGSSRLLPRWAECRRHPGMRGGGTSASSAIFDGASCRLFHFASTSSSMKLRRGKLARRPRR